MCFGLQITSKLFVLAAYFWSFVQGLKALTKLSGINDATFSNAYLSAGVAPLLLLAGLHSLSSASWYVTDLPFIATAVSSVTRHLSCRLIGGFFYPVMPVTFGVIRGLITCSLTGDATSCDRGLLRSVQGAA